MSEWLYSSKGEAVAFVFANLVFSSSGQFLGERVDNEIWNERYVGEILKGNFIVRQNLRPLTRREAPAQVDIPEWPAGPGNRIDPIMLPSGYSDLEIAGTLNSSGN